MANCRLGERLDIRTFRDIERDHAPRYLGEASSSEDFILDEMEANYLRPLRFGQEGKACGAHVRHWPLLKAKGIHVL